jgi:hypothetical protein
MLNLGSEIGLVTVGVAHALNAAADVAAAESSWNGHHERAGVEPPEARRACANEWHPPVRNQPLTTLTIAMMPTMMMTERSVDGFSRCP